MLGLGTSIAKSGKAGSTIVNDNLVLKHNYDGGIIHQVSTGAAFFDGTDDYITMGDVCDIGSSVDFSIALWVYLPEATSQYLISKYVDGNNFWYIRTQATDQIQFYSKISDGEGGSTVAMDRGGGGALSQNTWHHVALTADRSDGSAGFKIYYNGVLQVSGAANATDLDNAGNLYFGRVDTSYMGGNMCNVGIWNAVLTQAQIKSIMWKDYSGLTSIEKTNLVSWWNLDSTIDSTDTAGHGDTTVYDNHHGAGDTLGSELVTGDDSTFSGTSSNWTAVGTSSLSYDSSKLISTIGGGSDDDDEGAQLEVTSSITAGKTYKITVDLWLGTYSPSPTGQFRVYLGGVQAQVTLTTTQTTYTFYLTTSSTADLKIYQNDADDTEGTFFIDNVSMKLVNGNTGTLS